MKPQGSEIAGRPSTLNGMVFWTRASACSGGLPSIGVAGKGEVGMTTASKPASARLVVGHQPAAQALRLDVVDAVVEAAQLERRAQLVAERLGPRAQVGGMVGSALDRDRDRADAERGRHVGQLHLLDPGAPILEDRERRLDRGHHRGLAALEEVGPRDADAAAPDAVVEAGREVGHRAQGRGRIARVVARQQLQHQRRVAHAAGERPDVVLRPGERQGAILRDPAEGRLDADDAAAGGRLPDRGAGIAAERGVGHAGRDRRRGAAARAARMMALAPRVVDRPVVDVRAGGAVGQLVQVGLAEDHRAGALEALDRGGIVVRDPVGEQRRAEGGEDAPGGEQVLDRDRDALQAGRDGGRP